MESFSGGRAVLNLTSIPQLARLLERVQVNSLSFYSSSLSLDVTPL